MEGYEYEPLPNARHIRCVTIQPGALDDDIVMTVSATPFEEDNPPVYEALSYVWGSEENKRPVYIEPGQDGSQRRFIMVTQNLEVALRHLRHPDTPRLMWVDAICINQEDMIEKGPQVALMGALYRLASRVIVFLGASEGDGAHAMRLMRFIGAQVDVDWKTHGIAPRPGCADLSTADQTSPLSFSETDTSALLHLFERQWFERLWIRQEIYLATASTASVVCGHESVSWPDFRAAMFILSLRCKHAPARDSGDAPSARALALRLAALQTFVQQNVPTHLTSLREDFGGALCKNPRDRVYAAVSMLTPAQQALFGTPDYTRATAELYADAVLAHARYSATLNILAECDLPASSETRPADGAEARTGTGLTEPPPTWVPDWSTPSLSGNGFISTFASSSLAAWYEQPGPGRLRVAGIPAGGVIDHVEAAGFSPHEGPEQSLRRIFELISSSTMKGCHLEPYPDGGTVLEAWLRTLVCDDFDTTMVPTDDFLPNLEDTERFFTEQLANGVASLDVSKTGADGTKYASRVSQLASGKQLFFTTDGRLGLGPRATRPGDQVHALLGCDFLMVLRPCAAVEGVPEGRSFQVVGPAFMSGLTEGEAFLGPLPPGTRRVYVFSDEVELYEPGFLDNGSGRTFFEDPRLRGLVSDAELVEYRERLKKDAEARLKVEPGALLERGLEILDLA